MAAHSRPYPFGQNPKPLLLAAIEAVPSVRPQEASEILAGFAESSDEDIVEAVHEALAFCKDEQEDDDEEEGDFFLE